MKELLVVGGGFAGLWAALAAAHEADRRNGDVEITLVSPEPYLTIRPRLYEKNPEKLRTPLHPVLDPAGVSFVRGTVDKVDTASRSVYLQGPDQGAAPIAYDRLILATGSELKELPSPGMAKYTWNIDTYDAAVALDRHLAGLMRAPDGPGHNTFVIVGSGFTGIELATEMRTRLRSHSDDDCASKARVILVDRAEVAGKLLGEIPRPFIEEALYAARVETRLGVTVTQADPDGLSLSSGDWIQTRTIILTTGLRASRLAEELTSERDDLGRLPTDEMLRVKDASGVFACGDIARAYVDDENLALMSCQHARPMGKFAGYNAVRDLLGLPMRPYRQPAYVTCLDLGEFGALFTAGWDRRIQKEGEEAKQLKRLINGQRIYPPEGNRDAILAAGDIDN